MNKDIAQGHLKELEQLKLCLDQMSKDNAAKRSINVIIVDQVKYNHETAHPQEDIHTQ